MSIYRASPLGHPSTLATMVMLIGVLLFPVSASSQGMEFAVEVATMRSRERASEIANALVASGYQAYLVKTIRAKSGVFYRVRIGRFEDLDSTLHYGESLLDKGLLETCAITASASPRQVDTAKVESKSEDFLSLLSKTRWVLSSNQSIIYSLLPRGRSSVNSSDEIVVVMRAIDKNRWRLRTDIEFLTLPASGKLGNANAGSVSSSAIDGVAAEFKRRVGGNFSESLASSIPKSNRARAVSALADAAQPKLQGSVEMRNGQLVLILRNLDSQSAFNGTAQVSLSDGKNENEIAPLSIELKPGEEKTVPISEASMSYGGSVLLVYDARRAVQLIRSAPFGLRPKTDVATNQQAADQQLDQAIPETTAEMNATALEAIDQSLGDDDDSDQTDPANPAKPAKQSGPLKLTTIFEGEIEGGRHIAQKNPKLNE